MSSLINQKDKEEQDSVAFIKGSLKDFKPRVGLVLGSGLGEIVEAIRAIKIIDFKDIPGFSASTVEGHSGRLILGYIQETPIACYQGRLHLYEGVPYEKIRLFIRTLKYLGCETLVLTNSAGSLLENVGPGNLMLIQDHINFSFHNLLVGENDPTIGPRFISMEDAYDPILRKKILTEAKNLNINLSEGVYLGVLGPCFETPAEIRMYKLWGADAVGMSTVNETIIARHCGLKVLGLSIITNYAAGMNPQHLDHEETLMNAKIAIPRLSQLLNQFVGSL